MNHADEPIHLLEDPLDLQALDGVAEIRVVNLK
jgi:hypothetical protein